MCGEGAVRGEASSLWQLPTRQAAVPPARPDEEQGSLGEGWGLTQCLVTRDQQVMCGGIQFILCFFNISLCLVNHLVTYLCL